MSQRAKIASGRIVLAMWCAGLLALLLPALWTVRAEREAARERLAVEARNTAVQLSALLAVPAWDVDELAARTIVMAAMEDESIYAVKVQTPQGMQRPWHAQKQTSKQKTIWRLSPSAGLPRGISTTC